jgi:microcystin-dependent protein
MDEYYLAEIRLFAGNFEPRNWMFCDGRTLPINQNQALFSLLGTTYGGDGRTTFKLPDLRGRVPVGAGTGPGLTRRVLGEMAGQETVQLTAQQMPSHYHPMTVGTAASSAAPTDLAYANAGAANAYGQAATSLAAMAQDTVTEAGADQRHENVQPCIGLNYIICVYGIYPSRD